VLLRWAARKGNAHERSKMLIQGREGLLNEATVSPGKTRGSPGEREIPVHAAPRRFPATDIALRTRASPEQQQDKKRGPDEQGL